MGYKKKSFFLFIKKFFSGFDIFRRIIVNLFFLGIILLIISSFATAKYKFSGDQNTLVIKIQGNVVEEFSGSTLSRTVGDYSGMEMDETLLWDIINSINYARDDNKINSILLDFRSMSGSGLGALTEIRDCLLEFKKSGKKIISYSDSYNQGRYYLASVADKVFADPMGDFLITGFSVYHQYYGEGLKRLGVDVNYFHAGKYKSYGEVFTRSTMSDAAKEENLKWSGDLWSGFVSSVSESRGMEKSDFTYFINNYIDLLNQSGGSTVNTALNSGFIDDLMNRDELRSYMKDISGYSFESESFNQISVFEYLTVKTEENYLQNENKIAIITARGSIYNGFEDPGNIGSDSLVELLDAVQFDSSFKALVLRIDSGGGSAFASEIIRRKMEKIRSSGIPVVISMGSVAASGGYWIATASDEIWAQPTTLTGSIGVFSLIPTFEEPLNTYLGINVDGVGTTWMAGSMRGDRDLNPQVGEIYQSNVDNIYSNFLTLVGDSRSLTINEVDNIAQGRVWSGSDAKEIGLVDKLGGLEQAVLSAAQLADLNPGEYQTEIIQLEIPLSDQIIGSLLSSSVKFKILSDFNIIKTINDNHILKKLDDLKNLNDPSGVYALSTVMFE